MMYDYIIKIEEVIMTNILIQKDVVVLRDDNKLITLKDSVCVDAEQTADGGYEYRVGNHTYYASAGTVRALKF